MPTVNRQEAKTFSDQDSDTLPNTPTKKPTIHNVPINFSNSTSSENGSNSALALGIESCKQRIRILEQENRRLMTNQGMLVADANRRVDVNI